MTNYEIAFDRIGRNHGIPPQTFIADDPDGLAEQVYRFARPKLVSRDVEVYVDMDEAGSGKGRIYCGFQSGGSFTIKPQYADHQ